MKLEFSVTEQTLKGIPTESVPHMGSRKYLQLVFHLSSDWDGYVPVVFFQGDKQQIYPAPIKSGEPVTVPDIYLTKPSFQIFVLGIDGEVAVPTNVISVNLGQAGSVWLDRPEAPEMPVFQELIALVQEALSRCGGDGGSSMPEGAINVKDFGVVGDGQTDDTAAINAVIESAVEGDVVYFPAGTYLVSSSMSEDQEEDKRFGAIQVVGKSRISIVMSDGAYIKHAKQTTEEVSQHDMTRYYVFNVAGASDILISGGHVIGEMDEHDYHWFVKKNEWVSGITSTALSDYPGDTVGKAHGYGICVRSSRNVTIRWVDVSKCYGDGIMVSPGSGNKPMGVLVDECVVHDCIRQGVSSAGSDECIIRRCEIYNIRGGLPQSGIDLEPDSIEHSNDGTVIDDCYIHDCASYGLVVTKAASGVVVKNCDIMVRSTVNCIDEGDPVRSVKFEDCNLLEINTSNVERNQFVGCTIGAYGSYGLGDTFVDCTLRPEAFDDRVFGFSRNARSLISVNTVANTAEIELLSCTMVSPSPAEGESLLDYMFFRNNVQSKRIVMDGCTLRSNADKYFGIRLVGQSCVLRNNHISTDLSHLNEVFLSVAGDSVDIGGNTFDTLCAKSVRDNDGSKNTVSVSATDILVKDNTFFIAYPLGLRALRTSTSHKPIQRQVVTGNIFHGRNLQYSMSLADSTGGSVVCNNIADDVKSAEALGLVGKDGDPGDDGKDGGFYTPTVTQLDEETVEVVFAPSVEGMPNVPARRLLLPSGKDGRDAHTPVKGVDYYTPDEKAEFEAYIAAELAKRGQLRPEFANGIEGCTDPTKIYVLPDNFLYAYILTEEQEGGYTNVVDISNIDDPDNSDGFTTKSRLNPSSAVASTSVEGAFVSNVFACKPGDILRIKGITGTDSTTATAPGFVVSRLKEDGSPVTSVNNLAYLKEHPGVSTTAIQQCWDAYTVDGDGVITWTFAINNSGSNFAAMQGQEGTVKIRIGGIAPDGIDRIKVTVNEEMVEPTVVKRYAWANTGHPFIPTDYEDRILSLEEAADSAERKMADLQAQIDSGEASAKSGARWFALGDSITEGWASALDGTGYTQFLLSDPEDRWVNIVAKKRGYQLTNYGIGGTGYLRTKETTMNARQLVDTLDFTQCDFVTLAYGVNDWKYAVNVGSMDDDIEAGGSMVANMRYVIKKILTDNPLCKIFVITPLNCKSLGTYDTNWGIHYKGSAANGLGLEDIYALQKAVCEYHGIELIDMTHAAVVNRDNIRGILPDGIHPSAEGHLALANELCGKIKFG